LDRLRKKTSAISFIDHTVHYRVTDQSVNIFLVLF
jgi:hypothetical protein